MSFLTDLFFEYYVTIYYSIVFSLSVLLCVLYSTSHNNVNLVTKHSAIPIFLICAFLIVVLAYRRPESDSYAYAFTYRIYSNAYDITEHNEGIWTAFNYICKHILHLSVSGYFMMISLVYIGCTFWSCCILIRENAYMAMLFCLASFSFLAFGVNTLRNGFACSILLLAFSFWIEHKNIPILVILCVIAFGCHRSTALPILAFVLGAFVIKDTKVAILCWFLALLVSLVFGSFLSRYAGSLGIDDRISGYIATSDSGRSEYKTGFRWDFLLYSFLPILYVWYIVVKRRIVDKKFCVLANTYILANAAWLQFIRVAYTDRFAYLSWFLYPIVLAYASIRVPIWKDQDRKAALILSLQTAFTAFMHFR